MKEYLSKKLGSKKLRATILGVVAVIMQKYFGLDEAMTTKIIALLSSYVIGQGIADAGKEAVKFDKASK